jgi:pimeloyl-ACP methyl ester carboxylesterase
LAIEDAGTPNVVVLGTSRGGVIAMTMAAFQPGVLAGAILNDLGAQLEATGLERIYGVLRSPPSYASWDEAAAGLKRGNGPRFPNVSDAQWHAFARALYREDGGRILGDYDPKFPAAILEGSGTNPRTESGAARSLALVPTRDYSHTEVLRGRIRNCCHGDGCCDASGQIRSRLRYGEGPRPCAVSR